MHELSHAHVTALSKPRVPMERKVACNSYTTGSRHVHVGCPNKVVYEASCGRPARGHTLQARMAIGLSPEGQPHLTGQHMWLVVTLKKVPPCIQPRC
jgi:hypothetical protein